MHNSGIFRLERADWQVVTTLLAAFTLVVAANIFAIQVLDEFEGSSVSLEKSYRGIEQLHLLDQHLRELDNNVRYLIDTGDEKFMSASESSLILLKNDLLAIRYSYDAVAQKEQLDELEEQVAQMIRFNQTVLDNHRLEGKNAAVRMYANGQDSNLRDRISRLIDSLRNYHRQHLDNFLSHKTDTSNWLRTISWMGVIAVFCITLFSIYYLEKTARKRHEAQLDKEKKQQELEQHLSFIKDLYNYAPIGFHSTDQQGRFLEMNQTELDWLGYKREEVVGKMNLTDLIPAGQQEDAMRQLQKLAEDGKLYNQEGIFLKKDGTPLPVMINSRAVYDGQGRLWYARSALMDFTERKQLEEDLRTAREHAEHSSRIKEQFVANMSHEIRTPLNAILGFSNLLQRTELLDNQREFARNIQTSSENLLGIINDILDFSKIEAGVLRIEHIPFSLRDVIRSVEEMFHYKAVEKKLPFTIGTDQNIPETVLGDPTRLTQILVNLLGNAFKFTPKGSIGLSAELAGKSKDEISIRFRVTDTGIGIPPEKQTLIFERFGQASPDATRQYGGAGLGLTISRQLVELQGGTIRVESEEGKGSTFTVELPYKISGSKSAADVDPAKKETTVDHPVKILVVEDNPMNLRIVELLLDQWGFRHEHAENGKIALAKLSREKFDLVLMDVQMPEMDGYAATQAVRRELQLEVPIIATTAHAFSGEREKCIAFGMNDYISKPVNENELLSLILRYTPRKRNHPSRKQEPGNGSEMRNDFDRSYVMNISKGKPAVLKEMASLFISQSKTEISRIEQALKTEDFREAAQAVHSLKSTASYMGFGRSIGPLLEEMETSLKGESPQSGHLWTSFRRIAGRIQNAADFVAETFMQNLDT